MCKDVHSTEHEMGGKSLEQKPTFFFGLRGPSVES